MGNDFYYGGFILVKKVWGHLGACNVRAMGGRDKSWPLFFFLMLGKKNRSLRGRRAVSGRRGVGGTCPVCLIFFALPFGVDGRQGLLDTETEFTASGMNLWISQFGQIRVSAQGYVPVDSASLGMCHPGKL